ncbi:putative phage abortive infection protein [Paenibacillus sp. MCAF9]|uniref:putative phage abortive infection protein n=1 Tax=Paenibacillus sp. MCAF9 TaxID=3233046 RepID=UPI003F9A08D6
MDFIFGFLICLLSLLIVFIIYNVEKKVSNSRSNNNKVNNHSYIAWLVILIGIISPVVTYILSTNDKLNLVNAGGVGDWLAGSSVPFLTFGAFLVAYFTFTSQKEELRLTREEYNRQTHTLNIQRFENTFFQMISLHNQILNSFVVTEFETFSSRNYNGDDQTITVEHRGREFLNRIINRYGIIYSKDGENAQSYHSRYAKLYEINDDHLGHYFRNLFHIIDFIDKSDDLVVFDKQGKILIETTFEKRKKYIRIIRAQLSRNELVLLFFNCYTDDGKDFYDLIVKYQLLNNLKYDVVLPEELHPEFVVMKQIEE